MRIKWIRKALATLDDIAEYIAKYDPQAAAHMVEKIDEAVQNLGKHPYLGRPGRVPNTRELVVSGTPYIVPYRVKGSTIEILRVLHAARRWPDDF